MTMTLSDFAKYSMTRSVARSLRQLSFLFHNPLHSMPLLGGPHRNTAIPFGVGKLEWWGYRTVKKN